LVERARPEDAPPPRDPPAPPVAGEAGALPLGADDHRPQLEEVEVAALVADPPLPVEDRAAVLELDPDGRRREDRAREREADGAAEDVECSVHGACSFGPLPPSRARVTATGTWEVQTRLSAGSLRLGPDGRDAVAQVVRERDHGRGAHERVVAREAR